MADVPLDDKTRTELEAAAFRRLVEHLRAHTDVQNIDLMNLAGFCRNCLSNWMKDAADARGVDRARDVSGRDGVHGNRDHLRTRLDERLAVGAVLDHDDVVPATRTGGAHEERERAEQGGEEDQRASSDRHSYL